MRFVIGAALLVLGTSIAAMAQVQSPEVDPVSGGSALTLLAGALLILHGRRKR